MDTLQKIVKVTQKQYDTLNNGGTVGDYTGINSNYIYFVKEDYADITYANLKSTASLGDIDTTSRLYAVGVDSSSKLCVEVPWTNTTYSKATNARLGLIKPWYSTTGASTYNGSSTAPSAGADNPNINARSTNADRYYAVEMDANGRAYVNVPWSSVTIDTSLSRTSTNPLQNKVVYSAFSSAVGYALNYYVWGENGSWRINEYNAEGNSLDIRYGVITITSQSANYDVSFSKKFASTDYTVVFGLYRQDKQNWFWSPLVQSKSTTGFNVFVRGNASGDNGGTLMYLAIRSN